jgi:tetratricopeptide (TPR) repeat protein
VHHAHQKGIIHRDIKPTNVLVRDQDDKDVPKIIDFGISKATASQRLTEKTVFTEMGQLIGTPEYMSPEQAEMGVMDVDTRTDVYLLGVMLYELLTGELPIDSSELRKTGLNEFRRRVMEDDPLRPSARVAAAGDGSREAAKNRGTAARNLQRQFCGDLDWITMKALEKERARRYPSASELAHDIRRYLDHEPVVAGPPSNVYRWRKFARRHRTGVAFATVVFVLLVGFASAMAVLANRLAHERDRATQEAATARNVSEFLEGLFAVSDPSEALGNTITAREILDEGAAKIETELQAEPQVQARMMYTMGTVYTSLGLTQDARPLLEHALEIRERTLGPDHLELADNLDRLAGLLSVSFGEMAEALELYRRALDIRQSHLEANDPAVASSINNLAVQLDMMGEHERAAELFEQAFEIWETTLGPDDPNTLRAMNNRAPSLIREGRFDEAEALLLKVLASRERALGPVHPDVARARLNLALAYEQAGDLEAARVHYERALEIREKVLGDGHRKVGDTLLALAMVEGRQGNRERADVLHRRARGVYETSEAFESPFVLYAMARFAALMERKDEALDLLRRAVVDHEFKARDEVLAEPLFAAWHDDPEFKLILAGVEVRAARSAR